MNTERESEEEASRTDCFHRWPQSELGKHDPYAALRVRDFRLYIVGNFLSITGLYMQTTAVLWEIHRRTASDLSLGQSALPLGLVGLVQVLPVISLALLSGHVADRFNRRYVIMMALVVIAAASTGLAFVSSSATTPTVLIYGCLFFAGVARAFQQPAKSSLMPQLVPRADFPNAVTWNSAAFQMAAVMGPALAGGLIAIFHSATAVFVFDVVAALMFFMVLSQIHYQAPGPRASFPFDRKPCRRGAVCVAQQNYSGRQQFGHVRGTAGGRRCAVADLCGRNFARRLVRLWLHASGARGRGGGDVVYHFASPPDAASRLGLALGRRRIRNRHHRVRHLAIVSAFGGDARFGGRFG